MLSNRKPSGHLFPHTISHYSLTASKVSGALEKSFALISDEIKSFVQVVEEDVARDFKQIGKNVTHQIFIKSQVDFELISEQDRIVYSGNNFRVSAIKNLCNLDRVFKIMVESEDQ